MDDKTVNVCKEECATLVGRVKESVAFIRNKIRFTGETAIILGSGLSSLGESMAGKTTVDYESIPHFVKSTAPGHEGKLILGHISEKNIICMQGRFHLYEGYSMSQIIYPIRVLKELGVKNLIVTNASGGINPQLSPGDFMAITDHINLMGQNPLIGQNEDYFGQRFFDMTNAYDKKLFQFLIKAANETGIPLKKGVYAALTGPNYETPAEIRMLRMLGADAVGMSTVPEVIAAVHSRINVCGISCITNMAAGITGEPLSSDEVIANASLSGERFTVLMKKFLENLGVFQK